MNHQRMLILLVITAALGAGAEPASSQPTAESFRAEVEARQEAAAQAAEVFLDPARSDKDRLAAVEAFPAFFGEKHLQAALGVARDSKESGEIRAAALRRADTAIFRDEKLISEILAWLKDPGTPPPLRQASLEIAEVLTFTTFGMQAVREDLIQAFRTLTADEDVNYRRAAFGALAPLGDDRAQRLLIQGAKQAGDDPLPPEECIRLLGLDVHGDYLPDLYEVFQDPPSEAARLEAIRLLGQYPPARPDLVKVLQDANSSLESRMAAIGTLNANDPEGFEAHVLPVLQQKGAPAELVSYGIQSELYRRKRSSWKSQRLQAAPDAFEQEVRKLSISGQGDVKTLARQYLRELDLEEPGAGPGS